MRNRLRLVFGLALTLTLVCPPSLAPGEILSDEDKKAAQEAAENVKKAYEFGKDPSTEKLLDTAITAMTLGYPPAGAALGAMKGLMGMLGFFNKPDMVAEAIKELASRLRLLEARVALLEDQVRQIANQQFKDENLARIRELKTRHRDLQNLVFDLQQRPTDQGIRRSLANRGKTLVDSFLITYDTDLWLWSDLDLRTQNMLPPDFKPLPTLEYYVSSLVFWMAAIETAANGDRQYAIQTYGQDLQRHAAFLSVRAGWNDLNDAPETLPEQINSRISCGLQPMGKYPDPNTRMCGAKLACNDSMARRANMTFWTTEFLGIEGSLCTLSANQAVPAEEEYIERYYGTDLMVELATVLGRIATSGTVAEPLVGRFDMRYYTPQFLYGVKADGTLLWFNHTITEDRNPPEPDRSRDMVSNRLKASTMLMRDTGEPGSGAEPAPEEGEAQAAPEAGSDAGDAAASGATERGIFDSLRSEVLVSPGSSVSSTMAESKPVQAAVLLGPPPPKISHSFGAPSAVGTGWSQFRDVYPAGGAGMYALTQDGLLLWYRHDGWQDGSVKWKGPVQVGSGWNRFSRIVPGGDGVLYGVEQNGDLRWYRENDYENAQPSPSWQAPLVVGTGWGHFIQVFSSGEGVVYAVHPDGTLLWYRHTGYLSGAATWEGPTTVGSGWQGFSRVFSPGEGHIYALRPTGELLWYRNTGYLTGAPTWAGPVEITPNWSDLTHVSAHMWGTSQGPIVK